MLFLKDLKKYQKQQDQKIAASPKILETIIQRLIENE